MSILPSNLRAALRTAPRLFVLPLAPLFGAAVDFGQSWISGLSNALGKSYNSLSNNPEAATVGIWFKTSWRGGGTSATCSEPYLQPSKRGSLSVCIPNIRNRKIMEQAHKNNYIWKLQAGISLLHFLHASVNPGLGQRPIFDDRSHNYGFLCRGFVMGCGSLRIPWSKKVPRNHISYYVIS